MGVQFLLAAKLVISLDIAKFRLLFLCRLKGICSFAPRKNKYCSSMDEKCMEKLQLMHDAKVVIEALREQSTLVDIAKKYE